VNEWTNIWLGIIAVATLLMALIQVGIIVAGAILARRVGALSTKVERELQPLMERVNAIGADAARISALATQQVERADALFADVTRRVDTTLAVVQNAVVAPAREGMAIVSALKATVSAVRRKPRRPNGRDEDDPLFIG
jgi:hypothetical protein